MFLSKILCWSGRCLGHIRTRKYNYPTNMAKTNFYLMLRSVYCSYHPRASMFKTEEINVCEKKTPRKSSDDFENAWKTGVEKQLNLLGNYIKEGKFSLGGLDHLMAEVLSYDGRVKEYNFKSMFLSVCAEEKAFEMGMEFVRHLTEQDYTVGVVGQFFRLCYNCKEKLTKDDHKFIYNVYQRLLEKYDVLDGSTCENSSLALSLTDKWRELDGIFKMCRETSTPSSNMYCAFISAAFDNNEAEIAWGKMDEAVADGKIQIDKIYEHIIKYNKKDNLNKLLSWLERNRLSVNPEVAQYIASDYAETAAIGRTGNLTKVTPRGICRNCGQPLIKATINSSEFEILRNAFLDPVLIGRDIFLKTKPSELKRFNDFLFKTGKVDVVLDGLNIAYAKKMNKNFNDGESAKVLKEVVKYYLCKSKKVIVLGRKHMLNWPTAYMDYIKKNANLFLTDNVSADDPFLLFATMNSGLGTIFVSRDFMRGHKFLLRNPQLIRIFSKWQQIHQHYFLYLTKEGKVHIREPLPHSQHTQINESGIWHLPLLGDNQGLDPYKQTVETQWLCLA